VAVAVPELDCGDVAPGDLAIPLVQREVPTFRQVTEDRYTPSTGKTTGKIVMAPDFDLLLAGRHKVYLSIGADKGLKPGDYLRVTRTYEDKYHDPESGLSAKAKIYDDTQYKPPTLPRGGLKELPRLTLGDMIVLHVHPRSATAMIMNAYEDMRVGDSVELMDVSDAPPVSAAPPAAAPQAGETATGSPSAAAAPAPASAPTITCTASPAAVRAGDSVSIACDAASPDNRPVTVRFSSNAGKITGGNNNRATLDTSEAGPGPIDVRATALDDRDMSASAVSTVNVEAAPTAPPAATKVDDLEFLPNSARVDNRAKAMLDDVALRLQRDPNSTVVLSGTAESNETPKLASQRAQNAMGYLTQSKGIDSKRILAKSGAQHGRTVEVWSVPPGATMSQQ
jgi:outer membrane protein OmpA-like peptidoglycan-associated protein